MTKLNNEELPFPVFSIHGDYLEEKIKEAMELKKVITELTDILEESENLINNHGTKLNLYINNVIDRTIPFDYKKNFIIFTGDNEISIYNHSIIDKLIKEAEKNDDYLDQEDIFNLLPKSKEIYKLNKKQIITCLELTEFFNAMYDEYESNLYELDDCNVYYQCLIDETKEQLSNIKLFDLKGMKNNEMIEPFNEDKHDLLIVKDKDTNKWKFIYLYKENRDEFISILSGGN